MSVSEHAFIHGIETTFLLSFFCITPLRFLKRLSTDRCISLQGWYEWGSEMQQLEEEEVESGRTGIRSDLIVETKQIETGEAYLACITKPSRIPLCASLTRGQIVLDQTLESGHVCFFKRSNESFP